jgi:hypothetical protein
MVMIFFDVGLLGIILIISCMGGAGVLVEKVGQNPVGLLIAMLVYSMLKALVSGNYKDKKIRSYIIYSIFNCLCMMPVSMILIGQYLNYQRIGSKFLETVFSTIGFLFVLCVVGFFCICTSVWGGVFFAEEQEKTWGDTAFYIIVYAISILLEYVVVVLFLGIAGGLGDIWAAIQYTFGG